MTTTELAIRQPPKLPGREITPDILQLAIYAGHYVRHMFPRSVTPEQATALILKGYELGFSFTAAPDYLDMLPDGPALNGQGVLALAHMSNLVEIRITDHQDQQGNPIGCTVWMKRRDSGFEYTATYTMFDAQRAGLSNKDNYKKNPSDMYCWRAVARCARRVIPDLLAGLGINIETDDEAPVPPHITIQAVPDRASQAPTIVRPETGEIIEEGQAIISDTLPPSQQSLNEQGFAPDGQELDP